MPCDTNEKIIRWTAGILFAAFAVINGFKFASLILLIAAIFVLPIRRIDEFIYELKPVVVLAASLALILVGVLTMPGDNISAVGGSSGNSGISGGAGGNSITGSITGSSGNKNDSSTGNKDTGKDNDDQIGDQKPDDSTDQSGSGDSGSSSDDNKDDDDKNQSVTDDKADYVLNTNTHKFHLPTCQYVKTIDEANIEYYSGSRQDLIDNDYKPCGKCKP